ncbi:PucR family transcriptional regulator [Alteribacillus bidgolensis]|uniref:PucR C-terminal helix-turn-helix domain-containing protein n=1 Tax=Alteribacillus bidgolensis TaxID=930129 RepID=A0A1G8J2B2_9BACI|nr:helix-turn-helix domain-containing protein [Alteribacillus bidgolensis]SDI25364.1 PucR C-terminal helix-turn-helix domain-containing protein [Alteribacillus bidgolensis]
MLKKLKKLFPSLVMEDEVPPAERHLYVFYKTSTQEKAGIKKEELTKKEREMLGVFLDKENPVKSFYPLDREWYAYLTEDASPPSSLQHVSSLRFFQLEGKKLYANQLDLQEALHVYFDVDVKCVFLHTHSLLVIVSDTLEQLPGTFDAEELAGILAVDLLLDVSVYSGRRVHATEDVRAAYQQEKQLFEHARHLFPKKRAFHGYEVLPFVFPLLENNQQIQLFSYAFAGLKQDDELIETLYHFFLSNLNISLTAKELHMHRNTLQYRLDKFIEQTGIDMKQFPNAAALYVLIKKLWE